MTITARVRDDGTLAISRRSREKLGLHVGDRITITIQKNGEDSVAPSNPLLDLIGIGEGGPADGAEDHDGKIYQSAPPQGFR